MGARVEGDFSDYIKGNPLYMHEYGHYIDSQIFGFFYLPVIGLPSLVSAIISSPSKHDSRWYEMRANRNAAYYFNKYYRVDWSRFKDYKMKTVYPVKK